MPSSCAAKHVWRMRVAKRGSYWPLLGWYFFFFSTVKKSAGSDLCGGECESHGIGSYISLLSLINNTFIEIYQIGADTTVTGTYDIDTTAIYIVVPLPQKADVSRGHAPALA